MLLPQEVTDLVGQIVANAGKLGLTWQIRPATVVGSDDDGNALVVIDGPDLAAASPIPATPLDGMPHAGARVFVVSVPPNGEYVIGDVADQPAVSDEQGTSGSTSSTSFTSTLTAGSAAGVAFTAPRSGRVLVSNSSRMINSGANLTYCGFVIREGGTVGSGSEIVSVSDGRALLHTGTTFARFSVTYLVASGLTPGSVYNIEQQFRVTAGTGTYANRDIAVIPTS